MRSEAGSVETGHSPNGIDMDRQNGTNFRREEELWEAMALVDNK